MKEYLEKISEAADYISSRLPEKPEIAVILGSGLGNLLDEIEEPIQISYRDIPGFPVPTVIYHEGKLVAGRIAGKYILVMKGRFHYYEGYDALSLVFHIRVLKLLGVGKLLLTSAAGGVNRDFRPGDIMVISDHIGFVAPSALRGPNIDEFGERFPDMTYAYDREARKIAKEAAENTGVPIREGVYFYTQGPMYETPAEIRAISILGGDAVGMSMVPEVTAAVHAGMKVLGISCITNMAAGILDKPLSHSEVAETASRAGKNFKKLVAEIIARW